MSFIGNGVGRQMIMPGQIAPAAVGISQLDNTLSNTFSLRNRIINGDCRVAQRASVVFSNGVFGYGGPDRYISSNNTSAGGQFTQSQGTITYNGVARSAVVQTVNTPPTTIDATHVWNGIQHRIEGYNCYDLIGQQATLSFIFNTNVTGLYSVAVADSTISYSVVSSFNATANVPVKVVITLPTLTGGVSIPNSSSVGLYITIGQLGGNVAASNNVWLNVNNGVTSGYTNWSTVANNFIALTELQLEAGVTATPFERRPIGIELTLCRRYYQIGTTLVPILSTTYIGATNRFGIPMRAVPTVTYTDSVSTANTVSTDLGGNGRTFSSGSLVTNITVDGFQSDANLSASSQGNWARFNWTANAEL